MSSGYTATKTGTVMPNVRTPRERLVDLAVWAAGEKARMDLGLPSEWRQDSWMTRRSGCGTTCCIAGKVALEDGGTPIVVNDDGEEVVDPVEALRLWESFDTEDTNEVMIPGVGRVGIETYARVALGLDMGQANRLFWGDNELADLIRIIRDLLAELPA